LFFSVNLVVVSFSDGISSAASLSHLQSATYTTHDRERERGEKDGSNSLIHNGSQKVATVIITNGIK